MVVATYLPLNAASYISPTQWWWLHISHSMVVATNLPLNAASDISPTQWWWLHISHSMVVATYLSLNAASDISPNQCLSEVLCTVPLLLCWLSSLEVSFAVSRALSNCVHAWSTLNFDYIYIYTTYVCMWYI